MSRYKPDWNKVMADCGGSHPDDNERVIVTRGTARLAKSAIRQSQEDVAYHNFTHAERELDDVLARPVPSVETTVPNKLEARILLLLYIVGDNGCTSIDMHTLLKPWFGRLYVALKSLETGGKVRSEWLPLEPGREHRRRIYFLPWRGSGATLEESLRR